MKLLDIAIFVSELDKLTPEGDKTDLWKSFKRTTEVGRSHAHRIVQVFDTWNIKIVKNDGIKGYDILYNILVDKYGFTPSDAEYWMTLYYFTYDYYSHRDNHISTSSREPY